MAIGFDPDAIAIMRHAGSTTDALVGRLGSVAALTVDEGRTVFRTWEALPRERVASGKGPKRRPVSDTGKRATRILGATRAQE